MPELHNREQVERYLAEIFSPNRTYQMLEFPHGWVCTPTLTQEEIAAGQDVGLTKLAVDSRTGTVIEYPSWAPEMVAEDYIEAMQTGRPPIGRQVYPRQWRVTYRRMQETPETIEYRVTVESQAQPPEPSEEYPLLINKQTLTYQGTGHLAGIVLAWAEMQSSRDGTWPEQGTFEE